jgi:hypothetical protein
MRRVDDREDVLMTSERTQGIVDLRKVVVLILVGFYRLALLQLCGRGKPRSGLTYKLEPIWTVG